MTGADFRRLERKIDLALRLLNVSEYDIRQMEYIEAIEAKAEELSAKMKLSEQSLAAAVAANKLQ